MLKGEFAVAQDADGSWFYYSTDDQRRSPLEHFPAREQAERAAQQFAYRLQKEDEIALVAKERALL
jgi:hypothetical protein